MAQQLIRGLGSTVLRPALPSCIGLCILEGPTLTFLQPQSSLRGEAGGALTGVVDSGVSNASSESELLMEREGEKHRIRQGPGLSLLRGAGGQHC